MRNIGVGSPSCATRFTELERKGRLWLVATHDELACPTISRESAQQIVRELVEGIADWHKVFEEGVTSVMSIRCIKHRIWPSMNAEEISGAECAICAVEDFGAGEAPTVEAIRNSPRAPTGETAVEQSGSGEPA